MAAIRISQPTIRLKSPAAGSSTYFSFQFKSVVWLFSALRQIFATGMSSSACLMMNALWASVNFDAYIPLRTSSSQESVAKNSSFKRSSLRGSDQDTMRLDCSATARRLSQRPTSPKTEVEMDAIAYNRMSRCLCSRMDTT